jgi:hypothetical protein
VLKPQGFSAIVALPLFCLVDEISTHSRATILGFNPNVHEKMYSAMRAVHIIR